MATDYGSGLTMFPVIMGLMCCRTPDIYVFRTSHFTPELIQAWLVRECLLVGVFLVAAYLLGLGVERLGWNANYTRKALGCVMLLAPILVLGFLPYEVTPLLVSMGYALFLGTLALFSEPLRRRSKFLATAFASIDRPEDRPHTLSWFSSSYFYSSLLALIMMWWILPNHPQFSAIALYQTVDAVTQGIHILRDP
jgi:hypothetical protein